VVAALKAGALTPRTMTAPQLLAACADAGRLLGKQPDKAAARAFFEQHFVAHRVLHAAGDGLLTGYYEPLFDGARKPTGAYRVPVYRRPPDLVTLIEETAGAQKADAQTHARKTAGGLRPFPTRQQIDEGALEGLGLELIYLKDSVDLFFMQLQGSGRVKLAEGGTIRVTYDGKNGQPYTSIGRHLIDKGMLAADKVSLDGLAVWLRADPQRGRQVMWENASYVFFRELTGKDADAAHGVLNIPLTPGRSLALDASVHSLGLPVFVSAPTLTHADGAGRPFHRLMVAQDVGGAIRGPERGDIYFGSGTAAGKLAGVTKHAGNLFVLLPVGAEPEAVPAPAKRAQP
jgi:membrane-bound lytic murein transglycosylase A